MKINWNVEIEKRHVIGIVTVMIMVCSIILINSSVIESEMLLMKRERIRNEILEKEKQQPKIVQQNNTTSIAAEKSRIAALKKKEAEAKKQASPAKEVIKKEVIKEEEIKNIQLVDVDWSETAVEKQFENPIMLYDGKRREQLEKGIYLVGKIKGGEYADKDLYLFFRSGMEAETIHFILNSETEAVSLKSWGIEINGIDNVPDRIITENSQTTLEKNFTSSKFFKDLDIEEKVFTDKFGRDFYQTKEHCVVTKLPNQTALAYNVQIPFINKSNGSSRKIYFGKERSLDDYTNGYVHQCGGLCTPLQIVSLDKDELIYTGRANSGDKIYELKDENHKRMKDLYEDKNTIAYINSDDKNENGSKYTYEEFLALRPLLYWKDPFGNWVEFVNTKFTSAAEMCKPVIYLYPEEKTDLEVKVFPNGGFTYTDPDYGDGWMVEANPDGKIVDLKTGKSHEYLFWEGIGIDLKEMESGWIVEKTKLGEFLEDKLTVLGLNRKEKDDFKEYWIGRLDEKGFYKISFVEQSSFDEIAPLEIFPIKPQNKIRIFMLAKKASEIENIKEQKLSETPQRNGFTVVEWGGALLK